MKTIKRSSIHLPVGVLVIGALIGASLGMLYAPRSGEATRTLMQRIGAQFQVVAAQNINQAGTSVKDRAGNLVKEEHFNLATVWNQVKEAIGSFFNNLRLQLIKSLESSIQAVGYLVIFSPASV
jgi:gas vesicle protein